jgi:hypothetical protein
MLKFAQGTKERVQLVNSFTVQIAAAVAWNPTLEPLDEKISKYIGGNPVRLDGKPRASGILDTVSWVSFVGKE